MISFLSLQSEVVNDTLASTTEAIAKNAPAEDISYFSFLMKGGLLIIPIILLLFFCVYVIIERYLSIKKATKQDATLVSDIKSQLRAGKIETALMLCHRTPAATGNILHAGISIIGRPISEIESAMEKQTNIEVAQMEKGLGYLGLISGIAPILGFIGTISGVIRIFYEISKTSDVSIGNISEGLYEKMISSGSGLVVGVVAYSAYHLFNMMIDGFVLKVQKQSFEIVNVIQQPHGH